MKVPKIPPGILRSRLPVPKILKITLGLVAATVGVEMVLRFQILLRAGVADAKLWFAGICAIGGSAAFAVVLFYSAFKTPPSHPGASAGEDLGRHTG